MSYFDDEEELEDDGWRPRWGVIIAAIALIVAVLALAGCTHTIVECPTPPGWLTAPAPPLDLLPDRSEQALVDTNVKDAGRAKNEARRQAALVDWGRRYCGWQSGQISR